MKSLKWVIKQLRVYTSILITAHERITASEAIKDPAPRVVGAGVVDIVIAVVESSAPTGVVTDGVVDRVIGVVTDGVVSCWMPRTVSISLKYLLDHNIFSLTTSTIRSSSLVLNTLAAFVTRIISWRRAKWCSLFTWLAIVYKMLASCPGILKKRI